MQKSLKQELVLMQKAQQEQRDKKKTLANETHVGRASWSAIVRLDRCCGECDQLQRGHERVRERPGPGERATHERLSPRHLQLLGEMR